MPVVISKKTEPATPTPPTPKKASGTPGLVLAFDVSSKTGIVVMNEKGLSVHAEEFDPKCKGEGLVLRMERMKALFLHTKKLVVEFKPSLAIVEGYATHGKFIQYTQFELGSVVRTVLYAADVPMHEVMPTSLKKFAVGSADSPKNKVGKDKVRLAVYKHWTFESESDNILDAYVLAKIGCCLAGHMDPSNKPQTEVIEALRKKSA